MKDERVVDGGAGDDKITLIGNITSAQVFGGPGSDTIQGGTVGDSLSGGDGIDYLSGGGGGDAFTIFSKNDYGDHFVGFTELGSTEPGFGPGDYLEFTHDAFRNLTASGAGAAFSWHRIVSTNQLSHSDWVGFIYDTTAGVAKTTYFSTYYTTYLTMSPLVTVSNLAAFSNYLTALSADASVVNRVPSLTTSGAVITTGGGVPVLKNITLPAHLLAFGLITGSSDTRLMMAFIVNGSSEEGLPVSGNDPIGTNEIRLMTTVAHIPGGAVTFGYDLYLI